MTLDEARGVFEHSPWVAERAWRRQPFASVDALHGEMMAVVRAASRDEQLALIRAHPELAGGMNLTVDSSSEQGRLGFTRLTREEFLKMQDLNARYREKFGFPFIAALRLHDSRESVIAAMERRLNNAREMEIENALEQIAHITRGRLERLWAS